MSSVRRNVIANFLGGAWVALMSVAFVPVYLGYIGAEGYGLVGFYSILITVLTVFDAGLGAAAIRQLARFSESPSLEERKSIAELIRSLELIFWAVSLLTGTILICAAPVISHHWLNANTLNADSTTIALRLMGVAFLFQWPASFYSGCLIGLQRQVRLNVLQAIIATVRGIGAVAALAVIAPTIEIFFAWQAIVTAATSFCLLAVLRNATRTMTGLARFSWRSLQSVGRFAANVGGINVLSLLLTQLDKVILSAMLSLRDFGIYTLAWMIASLLYRVTGPVYNAVYPPLSRLVEERLDAEWTKLFRGSYQLMSLVLVPAALCMAFYSQELIWVWTRDAKIAESASWPLALLATGTLFNGFMHLPYALQLAHGWTTLALRLNVMSVCILCPLMYVLAKEYGLVGGAVVWPLVNGLYVVFGGWISFGRLLPGERTQWYWHAVLLPILISAAIFGVGKYFLRDFEAKVPLVVAAEIGFALLLSVICTALALPAVRRDVWSRFRVWAPRAGA